MRITQSYNNECTNKKVVVYGAGRYGELAYWGLKAIGIKPLCFVDRMLAGKRYFDVEVIHPEDVTKYKEYVVLLASLNYFNEMLFHAQKSGCKEIYDILDLILLEYDESVLTEYAKDEKHNYEKYKNVVENAGNNKLVINHCEIVVTESCTLRCKDCANLMQYYEKPEIFDIEDIIRCLDRLMNSIDMLLEMRILGGEPFINPNLGKLVAYYTDNPKIKRITIYTNSTLMPSQETVEFLKHKKVSVHMSDYGAVSKKIGELDDMLSANNIGHYIHKYEEWTDLGKPVKRNYTQEALQKMYESCIMAHCFSFYRGKLYTCPRAGHGERLGLFKNCKNDYIDFSTETPINEIRKIIRKLIEKTEYITACEYCNGCSSLSSKIEAATQVNYDN